MTPQDILIICVMSVPMLIFSVFPGIKIGEYLEEKYNITERQKRVATIVSTLIFAFTLSSLLHFI
ncbi:hypothetical protein [Sulfurimonas sp.]|uniref:hypothetical protein n=1 Tax=Sulfurimonas sp. TaxID=2022749 RepID=UPI00286E1835|nr:hypothetical protein [Sulfurimonas sp.]